MPGDHWQKHANLRALYAYMWAHPGKKLLFMGQEFGQEQEWSHERSLDWHLLEQPLNHGLRSLVRDLNRVYRERPALWDNDFEGEGFYWLEPNDAENSVVAFARTSKDFTDIVAVVLNLTPVPRSGYRVGLPRPGRWVEAVNTDSTHYGGSDTGNLGGVVAEPVPWGGQPFSAEVTLPPLGGLWLVPED
jgi:1,4-alpha-glucan branching enzyme